MKWIDKELYEGHFKIIDSLCKEKCSKEFVLSIICFRFRLKMTMDLAI